MRLAKCPVCGRRSASIRANSHCAMSYVCACGFEGYGAHAYTPAPKLAELWAEAVKDYKQGHVAIDYARSK